MRNIKISRRSIPTQLQAGLHFHYSKSHRQHLHWWMSNNEQRKIKWNFRNMTINGRYKSYVILTYRVGLLMLDLHCGAVIAQANLGNFNIHWILWDLIFLKKLIKLMNENWNMKITQVTKRADNVLLNLLSYPIIKQTNGPLYSSRLHQKENRKMKKSKFGNTNAHERMNELIIHSKSLWKYYWILYEFVCFWYAWKDSLQ